MLILGHRGASAHLPENTLASYEAAIAEGADGIESGGSGTRSCDVQEETDIGADGPPRYPQESR
jgi:hypothetical protein